MGKIGPACLRSLSKAELIQVLEKVSAKVGDLSEVVSSVTSTKIVSETNPGRVNPSEESKKSFKVTSQSRKRKDKQHRSFDITSYSQRHVALHIAYFGENYKGFARQEHTKETIEFHLFQALKKTRLIACLEDSNYSRCGRTDKGVSALGQVVSLTVRSALSSNQLRKASSSPASVTKAKKRQKQNDQEGDQISETHSMIADDEATIIQDYKESDFERFDVEKEINYANVLNRCLPDDIMVLGWAAAPDCAFKARFGTKSRTYRYFFVRRNLDIGKMEEAGKLLEGEHDFRNFCKIDVTNVKNFKRIINRVSIRPCIDDNISSSDQLLFLEVDGTAFLWHQIRCIVAVLFLVGRGLEEPKIVSDLLNVVENPGKPVYKLAEEIPLMLNESSYTGLKFYYDPRVIQVLYQKLEKRWKDLSIKAAMTKNVLDHLDNKITVSGDDNYWKFSQHRTITECDYSDACSNSFGKSKEYIKLLNRRKCDTYEEKVKNLSDAKRSKANRIHGWNL